MNLNAIKLYSFKKKRDRKRKIYFPEWLSIEGFLIRQNILKKGTKMSKQKKKRVQENQPFMSQQCTICQRIFELSQGDEPCVIQIDNDQFCEQCLQKRLLDEQQQIKSLEQRYIYYKEYESSFNTKDYCQEELKENEQNVQDLIELQSLQKQVSNLNQLLKKTKEQCLSLKQKVLHIETEQDRFWDSINRFEKRSIKLEQKCLCAKLQLRTFKSETDGLCKNSLYHEVFKITIKDNIGYISGLAMGKRPQVAEVQWDEFNIGLGHLFLALNVFALKYDYVFVKLQQVTLKSYATQVMLYGRDRKYPISYTKQNEKIFGEVMEAILTEIYHFAYHIMEALSLQYNPEVKLPYPIKEKEFKIADININPNKIVEKSKWTRWTQAIKYLLIDWKHLMTIHVIYGKD